MTIDDLKRNLEESEDGVFLLDGKYLIHLTLKDRFGQSIIFKKINEDKNSDDEDVDSNYDDLFDSQSYYSDYCFKIKKEELAEKEHIEYYLERFENAKHRHIVATKDETPTYTIYDINDIIKIKAIINTFQHKYSDVAFEYYLKELKVSNLKNLYNLKNKNGLMPMSKDFFNGIYVTRGKITKEIEKQKFMNSKVVYEQKQDGTSKKVPSIKNRYLERVRNALNIRKNPNGTTYTDDVVNIVLKMARIKKMTKTKRVSGISSLLTSKREKSDVDRLVKTKAIIDKI